MFSPSDSHCEQKSNLPSARRQKFVNKGLSFLKGEKKGGGEEEEISEEGKRQSGAAVAEDEDQDSDSKEAVTTTELSKVNIFGRSDRMRIVG